MHYDFKLNFRCSLPESDDLPEVFLKEIINLIQEEADPDAFEVVATDYHKLPQGYRPFAGEEASRITLAPGGGVVHPWDEGAWIFPEDHPLRVYEEKAKQGDEEAHKILDVAAKAAKQLSP